MKASETNIQNAEALALSALAWILQEQDRAERFLALTGLAPDDLRSRATERAVLGAVLGFLEGHEADLIGCADAIGVAPMELVAARRSLEGGAWIE